MHGLSLAVAWVRPALQALGTVAHWVALKVVWQEICSESVVTPGTPQGLLRGRFGSPSGRCGYDSPAV